MDVVVERNAVVVVAGIPGAGKTTLIDRAVDRTSAVVLDTDDRRRAGGPSRRKSVRVARHYYGIVSAVVRRTDLPVVVHSRGTTVLARRMVAGLAHLRGRPAHLVLLMATHAEAVDGQRRRGRTIARDEMTTHVERFAGLVADRETTARREGWATITVLDRANAAQVGRIGRGPSAG